MPPNFVLLLDQAVKAGEAVEDVLLGALADALDESGDPDDKASAGLLRTLPHDYDDVSYHGSPIYECTFCEHSPPVLKNGGKDFGGRCEQSRGGWVRRLADRISKERGELSAALRAERRLALLKAKYGTED